MKTIDYLSAAKKRLGITSDYAFAQHLGVTRGAVSLLVNGKVIMSDETAIKIAHILDIDPLELMAAANRERAKTPEAEAVWAGLMARIATGAHASFDFLISCAAPRGIRLSA